MIKVQNNIGTITISQDYFTSLIGSTVTGCFGVVQMNISKADDTCGAALRKEEKLRARHKRPRRA